MSGIRIRYLKLVGDQPLKFSALCTVVLCSAGTIGLVAEMGKVCRPDLRLWLSVVIIRSAVRLASRLYVASLMTGVQGARSGNSKFVDILDVFGIVWFAVGNLLVFNDFRCVDVSPIVYFTSLFYIVFSYISFFTPSVIRCTLGICRPTAEADLLYLRQTADADREAAFIMRNSGAGAGAAGRAVEIGPDRDTNPDLTPERARYWADWLQSYGCFEVVYHPDMDLKGKQRRWKEQRRQQQAQQAQQAQQEEKLSTRSGSAADTGSQRDIEMGGVGEAKVGSQGRADGEDGEDNQGIAQGGRRREYVSVPTSSASAGDLELSLYGEEDSGEVGDGGVGEGDFCSVCLLPFEAPPPPAPPAPLGPAVSAVEAAEGAVQSGEGQGVVPQRSEERLGQGQVPEQGQDQDQERNWVIVRYPCHGHHYFHAHCLHSWLQVCSARYLNTHRVPLGAELRTDHRVQVTCPCCREHPRSLLGDEEDGHGPQQQTQRPAGVARPYSLLP